MALEIKGTVKYQGKTYEPTGELRQPIKGEWYMTASGRPVQALTNLIGEYFILREVKPPHQYIVGDWVRVKKDNPDGSDAVAGRPYRVQSVGQQDVCLDGMVRPFVSFDYIEPCEPPQPKYRPFSSAEEFKPHRDRWIRNPEKAAIGRVHTYNDHGVNSNEARTYKQLLEFGIVFDDDGTPCGVLVTE